MDLVLLHPETSSVLRDIPVIIQTPPDTIQTPPGIGVFMQYRALEKRQYLNIMTEYNLFANKFSTNTSPDTLRHHPDTNQTPSIHLETQSRHPRQRHFYVIQGTCPIYSALYYIKMSEGVWMVSGVSGWCLDGV